MSEALPTAANDDADLRRIADVTFGLPHLRDGQLAGMRALAAGRDVLAVMPTGYGKSAIYQVAALLVHRDRRALRRGLPADRPAGRPARRPQRAGREPTHAVAINSSVSAREQDAPGRPWRADGEVRVPDPRTAGQRRGAGPVAAPRPGLSWWMRPTASPPGATISGRTTCGSALHGTGWAPRPSSRSPRPPRPRCARRSWRGWACPIRSCSPWVSTGRTCTWPCTGITRTITSTAPSWTQVAGLPRPGRLLYGHAAGCGGLCRTLAERGLTARAYHAGQKTAVRDETLELFLDGGLDVVVATSAFGMGIDKADVRFVVHADITDSLDTYYQEAGRAGRDGEDARWCCTTAARTWACAASSPPTGGRGRGGGPRELRGGGPAADPPEGRPRDRSARRVTGTVNLLQAAGALTSAREGRPVVAWARRRTPRAWNGRRPAGLERIDQLPHRDDAQVRGDRRLPPPVPAGLLRRGTRGTLRQLRQLR